VITAGLVLSDVLWADYEAMLRIIGERRVVVNDDRGVMEVMAPPVSSTGWRSTPRSASRRSGGSTNP
jgi:hypothetical protein